MAFLVNFSRGGAASAGDTPAATAALPSPFPVVVSLLITSRRRLTQTPYNSHQTSNLIHQTCVGSPHALRDDFLQVFHIFGRSIMMLHFGAFARDVSRKEGLALEHAV